MSTEDKAMMTTATVSFDTYLDAACTKLPTKKGETIVTVNTTKTLSTAVACNEAHGSMSNVKCFADRITYDDHPMNTNCTGTPIPVTIPVGVCTPVATGERTTYKLIKAETYTCSSEGVSAGSSKGSVCCSDGSAPISDGDHTTPPCKDSNPPSAKTCSAGDARTGQQGSTQQGGKMQQGQQGGSMPSISSTDRELMAKCKNVLTSGTSDAALKAECDAFKARMVQSGSGGKMQQPGGRAGNSKQTAMQDDGDFKNSARSGAASKSTGSILCTLSSVALMAVATLL